MRPVVPLLALVASGCPSPELLPIEDGGEGPSFTLNADSPSASFTLAVEATREAMRVPPEERAALVDVDLQLTSFLGVCDDCDVEVAATATSPAGGAVTGEETLAPGDGAYLEITLDDAWEGCAEDAPCAFEVPVTVELLSEGWVTVDSFLWATVWAPARFDEEPEGAEVTLSWTE